MAQEEFTKSGELGKKIRSALGSAYRSGKRMAERGLDYTDDVFKEYIAEPLGNLDPGISNLRAAGIEFGAGLAGLPANLGRRRYYDIPTQFDEKAEPPKTEAKSVKSEQEETPTAAVSNNEIKKQDTRSIAKPAEEKSEPKKLWRVMLPGSDPSQDYFYETQKEATDALNRERSKILAMRERRKLERDQMIQTLGEKETIRRLGKNAIETDINKVGAIAGIKLPDKTDEELIDLKDKYRQRVASSISEASVRKPETEEERLTRKLTEAGATPEQRDRYLKNLERLSSGRKAREAASKEQIAKDKERFERFKSGGSISQFASDIAAKRASEEQLNQYNKQLSTLKRAYNEARRAGDYVEQYRIGDFINSYTAGVPKEMGARQKASQRGIIENRNKELAEMVRRDREARIAAERASRANPDYQQFYPEY